MGQLFLCRKEGGNLMDCRRVYCRIYCGNSSTCDTQNGSVQYVNIYSRCRSIKACNLPCIVQFSSSTDFASSIHAETLHLKHQPLLLFISFLHWAFFQMAVSCLAAHHSWYFKHQRFIFARTSFRSFSPALPIHRAWSSAHALAQGPGTQYHDHPQPSTSASILHPLLASVRSPICPRAFVCFSVLGSQQRVSTMRVVNFLP